MGFLTNTLFEAVEKAYGLGLGKFYRITVAGGLGGLTTLSKGKKKQAIALEDACSKMEIARKNLRNVVALHHINCAAYAAEGHEFHSLEEDEKFHSGELPEGLLLLQSFFPDLNHQVGVLTLCPEGKPTIKKFISC